MARYIEFDVNGIVIAELQADGIPGKDGVLPANMRDVTKRKDGPWLGKHYDVVADTFSSPAKPVDTPDETVRKELLSRDPTTWKAEDQSQALALLLKRL